jgi:hypothetical protein
MGILVAAERHLLLNASAGNPERAEWNAQRAQMRANARRTRELAERAQAKLDAKTARR